MNISLTILGKILEIIIFSISNNKFTLLTKAYFLIILFINQTLTRVHKLRPATPSTKDFLRLVVHAATGKRNAAESVL